MMGWMYDGGWLWMTFGFLLFVLFWGVVIWLIVWAVRKATGPKDTAATGGALDIAKMRYAKGEISKEQYEQIKKDLS
ncbi:MAG: SHOCT domain-containing protein [Syntrophales bacterium]|nr:SHOCT domain-containing protein [Syntrophales bacterium]